MPSPFSEQVVSLCLSWILRQLWIWIVWREVSDPVRIDFLSFPVGISAVGEKVTESLVTVQPGSELCLPDLELLLGESSHGKFFRWVYLRDRHREAVSLHRITALSLKGA